MKRMLIAVAVGVLAACATHRSTAPDRATAGRAEVAQPAMTSHGAAGWVGQEFAGRTTANGEIFDPMLMTASHRTLPFGTLLDVRNPKTGQTVRVRVNDRGPYVGDRLIDLSFIAAQQIGIADSGGGEVELSVVTIGRGDREPPAAFAVTVPDNTNVSATPTVETMPLPASGSVAPASSPATSTPATVEHVDVTEQHTGGVETRRQVAANGTSIVDVPVMPNGATGTPVPVPQTTSTPTPTPSPANDAARRGSASSRSSTTNGPAATSGGHFVVQVGAFSQESNAKALQQKLKTIGQDAAVDHTSLYHVHIGPFETRDQAVSVRTKLEAAGISAIIVRQ